MGNKVIKGVGAIIVTAATVRSMMSDSTNPAQQYARQCQYNFMDHADPGNATDGQCLATLGSNVLLAMQRGQCLSPQAFSDIQTASVGGDKLSKRKQKKMKRWSTQLIQLLKDHSFEGSKRARHQYKTALNPLTGQLGNTQELFNKMMLCRKNFNITDDDFNRVVGYTFCFNRWVSKSAARSLQPLYQPMLSVVDSVRRSNNCERLFNKKGAQGIMMSSSRSNQRVNSALFGKKGSQVKTHRGSRHRSKIPMGR